MKTNKITLAICTAIYATSMGYMINDNMKKTERVEQVESSLGEIREELNSASIELKTRDEKIDLLDIELQEKNNALECARQEIASLERRVSYNADNVTEPSGATVTHMKRALKDTALYEYAEDFIEAERREGVNAFFLAGIAAQESSWGTSDRAIYDNNLTGFGVYNKYSRGINPNSRGEGILRTAKLLSEEYLTPEGSCFNGYSAWAVNTKYCFEQDMKTVDYRWHESVSSIAYDLTKKANEF